MDAGVPTTPHSLPASLRDFPLLSNDEIVVDRELGSGGFCTVRAVRQLQLLSPDAPQVPEELARTFLTQRQVEARERLGGRFSGYEAAYFSKRHVVYSGGRPQRTADATGPHTKPPRIALKRLRPNLSPAKYEAGIKDLTSEVELLGLIDNAHPHIIGLHAVGLDKSQHRVNFAIIDQLRCTMKNKMYKWREARGLGIFISNKSLQELWLERMVILRQVASAVSYLHEKDVVHRDVTCANIGFDSDDCVKLFDFGLARVMGDDGNEPVVANREFSLNGVEKNEGKDDNATYNMSGCTGTVRFMAPEVYMELPYGSKVDVYSLSIVMWQVLSLLQPFADVPPSSFESTVIKGGLRPTMDAAWPAEVKDLLANMWSTDPARRPSSRDVVATLERLLRGSDEDLYPSSSLQRFLSEDKLTCELPQCIK